MESRCMTISRSETSSCFNPPRVKPVVANVHPLGLLVSSMHLALILDVLPVTLTKYNGGHAFLAQPPLTSVTPILSRAA